MFPSQKGEGGIHANSPDRASMGPGCFHPRKTDEQALIDAIEELQWGRDVSIPERRNDGRNSPAPHGASMGPGCFHPRKDDATQDADWFDGLQWGRDVSIPESGPLVPNEPSSWEASMGPGCFHPRKTYLIGTAKPASESFNGAGMFP